MAGMITCAIPRTVFKHTCKGIGLFVSCFDVHASRHIPVSDIQTNLHRFKDTWGSASQNSAGKQQRLALEHNKITRYTTPTSYLQSFQASPAGQLLMQLLLFMGRRMNVAFRNCTSHTFAADNKIRPSPTTLHYISVITIFTAIFKNLDQ